MHIYLIRHGDDLNPNPGYFTDEETKLSDTGVRQAYVCAEALSHVVGLPADLQIVTSPRTRTLQTATIIAQTLGIDSGQLKQDARLLERDCTAYVGQSVRDVFAQTENVLVKGGMESYASVYNRLKAFYEEAMLLNAQAVLIITHSGNVQPLMQIASQQPPVSSSPAAIMPADTFIQLC